MRGRSASSNWLRRRALPSPAIARRASRSADLLDRREVRGGRVRAGLLRALLASEGRIGRTDVAQRVEVALGLEPLEGSLEAAEAVFEGEALAVGEGREVVRRDELVLGPVDEGHELVEPVVGIAAPAVVEQRQVTPDITQQQQLADAVEHIGLRRQARVSGRLGEHAMAEAVEVADVEAGASSRADAILEALSELLGRLDVVGEHEDLLGQQGTGERFGVRAVRAHSCRHQAAIGSLGRAALGPEKPAHALDDDARLAAPGTRDDHGGAITPLDDASLGLGEPCRGPRFGHHSCSPVFGPVIVPDAELVRRGPVGSRTAGLPVDRAVQLAVLEVHLLEVGGLVAVTDALAAHGQPVDAAIGLVVRIVAERRPTAVAVQPVCLTRHDAPPRARPGPRGPVRRR